MNKKWIFGIFSVVLVCSFLYAVLFSQIFTYGNSKDKVDKVSATGIFEPEDSSRKTEDVNSGKGFLNFSISGKDETIKAQLLEELEEQDNSDIVVLNDGKILKGVVEVEGDTVYVQQKFGHSGVLTTKFKRDEIREMSRREGSHQFEVTEKEIEIKKEFPQFHIVKRDDYSFFTTEDYFFIQNTVRFLEDLHQEVLAMFESVIAVAGFSQKRCYVIIFKTQEEYLEYIKKYAQGLEFSSGHYSPEREWFVLFDQFGSLYYKSLEEAVESGDKKLENIRQQVKDYKKASREAKRRVMKRVQDAEHSVAAYHKREALKFKQENINVIRHEGAHQLFFSLGLHSTKLARRPWLAEGLAQYCETNPIGGRSRENLNYFRQAVESGNYISLHSLLDDFKTPGDIFSGKCDPYLFYAESWAFIYFLMERGYKDGFFDYLARINKFTSVISTKSSAEELEESFEVPLDFVEQEWLEFVSQ